MSLISQSEIEQRLGRSLTTDEASAFTLINSANQAYVEKMIGSKVEAATETTRYYDGGVQYLKIDPCTSITSVKLVDEDQATIETIDSSDYTTEPINSTLKTMIRSRYGKFYEGFNNMAVTALFSIYADTDTLNIVKNAMLEALVSELADSDNKVRESIEGYSVEYSKTTTKNALDSIGYLFPEII